jgi:hypothetical protein
MHGADGAERARLSPRREYLHPLLIKRSVDRTRSAAPADLATVTVQDHDDPTAPLRVVEIT